MTDIKERANESVLKYVHEEYNSEYKLGFYNGYSCGATEQQEIDGEIFQKSCNAINLMHYLDEHCPENKMCLSSIECEDLENAFITGDWAKVIRYIYKYIEI